jgi:hypothetical protein
MIFANRSAEQRPAATRKGVDGINITDGALRLTTDRVLKGAPDC